jgi:hypothetical protein
MPICWPLNQVLCILCFKALWSSVVAEKLLVTYTVNNFLYPNRNEYLSIQNRRPIHSVLNQVNSVHTVKNFHFILWDFMFPRWRVWTRETFCIFRRILLLKYTDVSEVLTAYLIRAMRRSPWWRITLSLELCGYDFPTHIMTLEQSPLPLVVPESDIPEAESKPPWSNGLPVFDCQ